MCQYIKICRCVKNLFVESITQHIWIMTFSFSSWWSFYVTAMSTLNSAGRVLFNCSLQMPFSSHWCMKSKCIHFLECQRSTLVLQLSWILGWLSLSALLSESMWVCFLLDNAAEILVVTCCGTEKVRHWQQQIVGSSCVPPRQRGIDKSEGWAVTSCMKGKCWNLHLGWGNSGLGMRHWRAALQKEVVEVVIHGKLNTGFSVPLQGASTLSWGTSVTVLPSGQGRELFLLCPHSKIWSSSIAKSRTHPVSCPMLGSHTCQFKLKLKIRLCCWGKLRFTLNW